MRSSTTITNANPPRDPPPQPGQKLPIASNLDIYRTASVLIREHGEEADLVAPQRADTFLEFGAMAGSAVRRRVLKAVKEIQREQPGEGKSVN